ncbi:MAG: ABC transporter permease [Clostridiales bacterium]|nr:ABC transporter permease [Clostridiales bacterium]MBQ2768869.1 ABC transporter permease [Clostridia bacterium]
MKHESTISREHLLYLRGVRKKSILVNVARISIFFAFLFIWELAARLEWVNPFITSSPSRVMNTIGELYKDGSLFLHVGTTLWETLLGFAIAVVLGYSIALILWWSEGVRRVLEPYFVVLNALPKIALGPLIIIWFGTGSEAIVFMTVLIGLIVAILNMLNGFMATDPGKLLLLRSMGASKLQILTKLVIPSSLPNFISMLKINVGMAWIGSIMGEYIVSKAGIGYLIVYGGQVFKLDLVMSAVFILCVLAAAMYAVVALIERLVIKNTK